MTTKTKTAMPPARALKDVAVVLARRGATVRRKNDEVTTEVLRSGTSHLKAARERYRATVGVKRKGEQAA